MSAPTPTARRSPRRAMATATTQATGIASSDWRAADASGVSDSVIGVVLSTLQASGVPDNPFCSERCCSGRSGNVRRTVQGEAARPSCRSLHIRAVGCKGVGWRAASRETMTAIRDVLAQLMESSMTNRQRTWTVCVVMVRGSSRRSSPPRHFKAPAKPPAAQSASEQGQVGPRYGSDGALLLPDDYRRWVFVGSSLGLSYGEGQGGVEMFHETLMEPTAYQHFVDTGTFREGTMLALILHGTGESVLPARRGRFAADVRAVEMAVKDTSHRTEGWAYYNFGGGTVCARRRRRCPRSRATTATSSTRSATTCFCSSIRCSQKPRTSRPLRRARSRPRT